MPDDKNLKQKRRHEPESGQSSLQPFKKQKTGENEARIKTSETDVKLHENKEDINDLKAEFGDKIIEEINNSQDGIDEHSETASTSPIGEGVRFEPLKCSQWEETASGTLLIHNTAGLLAREKVQCIIIKH